MNRWLYKWPRFRKAKWIRLTILESLRRLGREEQVTTVALDLGYNSPSAFIAMFKKALGKTPGQYFKEAD